MRNTLLISVSAIALIAGSNLAFAQTAQGAKEHGGPPAAQQNAPPEKMAPGPKGAGASKESPGVKGGAAHEDKVAPKAKSSQGPSQEPSKDKAPKATQAPAPQQGTTGQGSTSQTPSREPKAGPAPTKPQQGTTGQGSTSQTPSREPKAGPAPTKPQQGTIGQGSTSQTPNSEPKAGPAPTKPQQGTTGQGSAGSSGASLSTDQRTKITTIIKQKNFRPVTNVTFAISVGAVVPASVHYYPLPVEVVEVYPEWRGYLFILVDDEILVIHPQTHRIVAVLEV